MGNDGSDAFVVTGSLNLNVADRFMDRRALQAVQVILPDHTVLPVEAFKSVAMTGLSSLAFHPLRPDHVFASTGASLLTVDLQTGGCTVLDPGGLNDVHEICVIGDTLWIANTGRDEVIGIDCHSHAVVERRSLEVYRSRPTVTVASENDAIGLGGGELATTVDRFHCNQVFVNDAGNLMGLVHHVAGRQLLRRAAERLLKSHGNGGLVDLASGDVVRLGLKAPHSIRRVGDSYWVLDSGRGALNLYSLSWESLAVVELGGWGRGMAVSGDGASVYVGISAKRRRYLGPTEHDISTRNGVVVVDKEMRTPGSFVEINSVEQINNVYRITVECARSLADLPPLSC